MNLRQGGGRLFVLVLLLGAVASLLPVGGLAARADEAVRAQRGEWWSLGWSQISRGEFEQATETFRNAALTSHADQGTREVSDWLEAFEEIQRKRDALRESEFANWLERTEAEIVSLNLKPLVTGWLKPVVDAWVEEEEAKLDPQAEDAEQAEKDLQRLDLFYIERADEAAGWLRLVRGWRAGVSRVYYSVDETRWVHVLGSAHMAYLNAPDPEAFRDEPWMMSLVERSLVVAAEKKQQEKWLQASGIYFELERTYDENPGYEKLREDAQTHYRLEAIYADDPADLGWRREDWTKMVRGADPSIVGDALQRIGTNYVRRPDFKKIIARGLDSILLMAQTPALKDTFEGLNDELMTGMFNERVNKLRSRLEREKHLSARGAVREYWSRLRKINRQTIRLPEQVLAVEFMEGALKPLDQFSAMIWPSEVTEFRKYTTGEFTGVGIQINVQGEYITVFSPLEDTPAYRAGIRPGDVIVKINGQDAAGINLNEAVERITGPVGTSVTLTVKREDEDQEIDFVLERANIQIQSVKGAGRQEDGVHWNFMLDDERGIAYIRLANFSETTADELEAALKEIEEKNARGLILDVRFNPGGLLTAAWKVADLLLPANRVIVRTVGRDPGDEWHKKSRSSHTDLPLIVLVNERSASASEIVSGAVKDHQRGLIVGERTFGKGSVQNLIPMADNEAYLKLTTALYYLPSGRCLQRGDEVTEWGVEPDIEVKLVPKENRHVLTVRQNNDIIGMGGPVQREPELDEEADEAYDAQLETALLLMRIKLASDTDWTFPDEAVAAADEPRSPTKN